MAMIAAAAFAPDRVDDDMLVERMVRRDADALAELYDRYGRVVFGVLHQMLPGPEAAEEVCQDVFHRLWRAAGSYAIARNAAIDWRRTRGKRTEQETELGLEALSVPAQQSVEDLVGERLRAERMRALVATLPAEQRRCIELAFWQGLSQSEIAIQTETPLGTVKSRIHLAMEKLRAGLPDA